MTELTEVESNDLLTRTVTAAIAEPFVMDGRFSTSPRFYADRVRLVFQCWNGEPWKLYEATVSGSRCLKDGSRGVETRHSNYPSYAAHRRPDWLNELIDRFIPEA